MNVTELRGAAEQAFYVNASRAQTRRDAGHAHKRGAPGRWGLNLPWSYPLWDFEPGSSDVVYGTNAGGMFVIEAWMDDNWFKSLAPGADDMYGLIQALGGRAASVLAEHYSTWITESDIDAMAASNLNMLRIPVGWWSFLQPNRDEGWVYAHDLYYLSRLLGWLHARGMYAIIDMHSMPGGQSGDKATGHGQGSSYTFFTKYNQDRADHVIRRVRDFILTSPFGRAVAAVLVANEPCVNTFCAGGRGNPDNEPILRGFYERSYNTLSAVGIPMMFHHGWASGDLAAWTTFVQARNPALLVASDNPYPGAFPSQTDANTIWSKMCSDIRTYNAFPTKVISTEWSLASGMPDSFLEPFYNSQAWGYSQAGGSCFWSYKVINSTMQPTPEQWSWSLARANGVVANATRFIPWLPNRPSRAAGPFLAGLPNIHRC